jgi:hypothetical protein
MGVRLPPRAPIITNDLAGPADCDFRFTCSRGLQRAIVNGSTVRTVQQERAHVGHVAFLAGAQHEVYSADTFAMVFPIFNQI